MPEPSVHPKTRLLLNALVSWGGTIAQMVAVFLVSPILVHGLGDARYGVWAFVESILAYLTLFDLGIGAAVVRYVARFEGTGDLAGINRTFSVSLCLFAAAGLGVLGVAGLILGPVWPMIPVPAGLRFEAWWLMALLSFNLAAGLPLGVFAAVLDGLQCYVIRTAVRISVLIVRSAAIVAIVWHGGGLFLIAVTVTIVALLENLLLTVLAFWYLPGLRFSPRLVNRGAIKMIGGYSINAFVAMIAGRLSFQTDAIVIGWTLPLSQVTFFALPARLCEYAKNALRSMTYVLTPYVSRLEGLNELSAIRGVYIAGTRWILWLMIPVQLGIWLLGRSFFRLWIGPDHADHCYAVLVILATPLALALSQSIASRILYGIGKIHIFSRIVIAEAIANLALSLILVGPYGIQGVAVGTTIPNLGMNVVLIGYTCGVVEISWGEYLRKAFLLPWALALVPVAAWFAGLRGIPIGSWPQFVLVGGLLTLSYAIPAALLEAAPQGLARVLRKRLSRRPVESSAL